MHAATINADEFFQGPFEVFDKDTKSILYLGEDETRPMAERVDRFLETYSGETFRIDSRDLELPGIPQKLRSFVAPLVYYILAFRLAAHYAAVRGYSLEGRRAHVAVRLLAPQNGHRTGAGRGRSATPAPGPGQQ